MPAPPHEKADLVRGRKRQRKKAPKTRSGCITCKIRHTKCDETKPNCQKCTSTGRKCDGYAAGNASSRTVPPARPKPRLKQPRATMASRSAILLPKISHPSHPFHPVSPSHSPIPRSPFTPSSASHPTPTSPRALAYFIQRSEPALTGAFCVQVWRDTVLRMCVGSTAVANAIVALAGVHELVSRRPPSSRSSSSSPSLLVPTFGPWNGENERAEVVKKREWSEEVCWRHYVDAVRSARELVLRASRERDGLGIGLHAREEVLIVCAVFVVVEMLLGNFGAAERHLRAGLGMVGEFLDAANAMSATESVVIGGEDGGKGLEPGTLDLIGLFARLDLQFLGLREQKRGGVRASAKVHERKRAKERSKHPIREISQPLPNVPSAGLYRFVKRALYWIRDVGLHCKYAAIKPEAAFAEQDDLLFALAQWRAGFPYHDPDLDWAPGSEAPRFPVVANLLVAYHLIRIKVWTALSASENVFDEHDCRLSFEAVVENAEVVLAYRSCESKNAVFSLEASVVEPLWVVAVKCRDSVLRRRAVELLESAGREGVWDGDVMANTARIAIGIEEEDEDGFNWGLYNEGGLVNRGNRERINDVIVSVDQETGKASVDLGWFEDGAWRWETRPIRS
ncbi:hypothetical protein BS50DRAFT_571303 [Corynespora cassiicola Philippines]|uniref:Zn(2)-C6 fungal-type domain-containing protein n=1 Tax=Corynespora cassiicola Philippines TaxID=1448308 RepID=A0A2T2NXH9_CORCC|nr:hypothetical protein BS50DRAFT_571303 [Corynespora cassiicola Philippines]